MSLDNSDIGKIRAESSGVATEKAQAELTAEEKRACEAASAKGTNAEQPARTASPPRQRSVRGSNDDSTPTLFFLTHPLPKLEYTPAYFFHPEDVRTMALWGKVVWERWNAWNRATRQAPTVLKNIMPTLRAKCNVLIVEARKAGFAFWAWDGLSSVPVCSSGMELRLWAINQLNVLRGIEEFSQRWLGEQDKLLLSGEDIALLNLARPLFEQAQLDEKAWIGWQGELFRAGWPRNAKNGFAGLECGGLLGRATSEAAYYQELMRITWERMRNLATMRPNFLIPLPYEPVNVTDNQAARRALDTVVAFSAAWLKAEEKGSEEISESPRMTVEEANKRAMRVFKQLGKAFFLLSEREQAKRIGCHWQTWTKTKLYKRAQKIRNRAMRQPVNKTDAPAASKVVSLTSSLEAVLGEGDRHETLNQLIAEQAADSEPSPLDNDPPDRPPQKVRTRKRL
jgi:hypothetical protein